MDKLLMILALLGAAVGFFFLSEATMGVGIIGLACFLGILTRIVQAGNHQDATRLMLKEIDSKLRELNKDAVGE